MSERRTIIHKEGTARYVLVEGSGQGGFLDPPGSVTHTHSLECFSHFNQREADSFMSIPSALEAEWVPEAVKIRLRSLVEAHPPKMDEAWVRQVYGYFRHCYSPDGEDRNVSNCLIVKPNPNGDGYVVGTFGRDGVLDEPPPPVHHLGYLFVSKHFPDHVPRTNYIADPPQWGTDHAA